MGRRAGAAEGRPQEERGKDTRDNGMDGFMAAGKGCSARRPSI